MAFSYEIKNGLSEVETAAGTLYVVKRSLAANAVGNYACNVFARSIVKGDHNVISILYRPERLGQLKLWRDIPQVKPHLLVRRLADALSTNSAATPKDAGMLMTRLALTAATGILQKDANGAATELVELLPLYEAAISQQDHLHTAAIGVLAAHVGRQNSVLTAVLVKSFAT